MIAVLLRCALTHVKDLEQYIIGLNNEVYPMCQSGSVIPARFLFMFTSHIGDIASDTLAIGSVESLASTGLPLFFPELILLLNRLSYDNMRFNCH